MRFTLALLALAAVVNAVGASAQAKTFRYREFVPANQDCAAELAKFKTRFEAQTSAKVVDSNCAAVSIPGDAPEDNFEANAATLIYESKQELIANSVMFGVGTGSYDSVGLAGNIGGSYEHLADCTADLQHQQDLFRKETKAEPVAAYCVAPSQQTLRFNIQIDSFQPLAKRLYLLEAFRESASDDSRKHVAQIVASTGVTVAHTYEDMVFFYDTAGRSAETPAHITARNATAGLFDSLAECTTQQPKLVSVLQAGGYSNFEAACTGDPGVVALELVSTKGVSFDEYGGSNYASLAECNADSQRLSREAAKQRGAIGGICTYQDSLNPLRAYGFTAVYAGY